MNNSNVDGDGPDRTADDQINIGIAGMTCDSCVRRVERALRELPGVHEVRVDREAAVAMVRFDGSRVDVPEMHEALLKSGYRPVATLVR